MFRKIPALVLFASLGCTGGGKDSPQKVLGEYVSRSFAMKSVADVAGLKELATDSVRAELEKLERNEAMFRKSFIEERNKFVSLKIRDERSLGPDLMSITYELTYLSTSAATEDKVTSKKHALFVQKDGKWLVSEVKAIKTLVEHGSDEKIEGRPRGEAGVR